MYSFTQVLCFLFIPMSLLVFRVRIGRSGCNVSLNVPMRADSLGLLFGDAESGTEVGEEPGTRMGEETGTEIIEESGTEISEERI